MALIKCGECGKEISDRAATCIGCGAPIAAAVTPNALQSSVNDAAAFDSLDDDLRSQTEFIPRAWETIIFDNELGSYMKNAFNVDTGNISLTDRRIVFCGKIGTYAMLAVFGALALLAAGKAPKIHFQLILQDIAHIELGRHGFTKIFVATAKDGKKYKFLVRNYEKWISALSDVGIHVHK